MPKPSPGFALATAAVLVLLTSLPASTVFARCGSASERPKPEADLASFGILKPLYLLLPSGLTRRNLATDESRVIEVHDFDFVPDSYQSDDRRWVLYQGESQESSESQHWLFDTHTETLTLLDDRSSWEGAMPSFSPDDRWIVFSTSYDSPARTKEGVAVVLYDLESKTLLPVPAPDGLDLRKNHYYLSMDWQTSGEAILLNARDMGEQDLTKAWRHFRYSLERRRYTEIEGHLDRTMNEWVLQLDGARIDSHVATPIASNIWYRRRTSPARRWEAGIDDTHRLTVSDRDGEQVMVDTGHYDECAGDTIRLYGWIDDSHLVYANDNVTYVYDANKASKAILFTAKEKQGLQFFW